MAKVKGYKGYSPIAISNLGISSSGFDILKKLYSGGIADYNTHTPPEGYIFIGIQSLNGVGKVMAKSSGCSEIVNVGADCIPGENGVNFSTNGNFLTSPSNSDRFLKIISGDTIYGRFKKILIWKDELGSTDAYFKVILAPKNNKDLS